MITYAKLLINTPTKINKIALRGFIAAINQTEIEKIEVFYYVTIITYGFERLTLGGFTHGDSYQASVQHSEMNAPAVKPFFWVNKMKELTQERLKQLFYYDPDTGIFTRIAKIGRRGKIGDTVGTVHKIYKYVNFRVDGVLYLSHRLAWLYVFGYLPKFQVDHINHNRADNKISNLREATHSDNQRNKSLSRRNKSGFTGVYWYEPSKKWHASIMGNGKTIHLGYFLNKIDAVKVRKDAELKYGFHKNHGGVL